MDRIYFYCIFTHMTSIYEKKNSAEVWLIYAKQMSLKTSSFHDKGIDTAESDSKKTCLI